VKPTTPPSSDTTSSHTTSSYTTSTHTTSSDIRARTASRDVPIADASIRLGQLLKLAGLVDDGGQARAALDSGAVRVDGEVETRRGRQVRPGDVVTAPSGEGGTVTLTVSHR
jgi:ribosome-associated protein